MRTTPSLMSFSQGQCSSLLTSQQGRRCTAQLVAVVISYGRIEINGMMTGLCEDPRSHRTVGLGVCEIGLRCHVEADAPKHNPSYVVIKRSIDTYMWNLYEGFGT